MSLPTSSYRVQRGGDELEVREMKGKVRSLRDQILDRHYNDNRAAMREYKKSQVVDKLDALNSYIYDTTKYPDDDKLPMVLDLLRPHTIAKGVRKEDFYEFRDLIFDKLDRDERFLWDQKDLLTPEQRWYTRFTPFTIMFKIIFREQPWPFVNYTRLPAKALRDLEIVCVIGREDELEYLVKCLDIMLQRIWSEMHTLGQESPMGDITQGTERIHDNT